MFDPLAACRVSSGSRRFWCSECVNVALKALMHRRKHLCDCVIGWMRLVVKKRFECLNGVAKRYFKYRLKNSICLTEQSILVRAAHVYCFIHIQPHKIIIEVFMLSWSLGKDFHQDILVFKLIMGLEVFFFPSLNQSCSVTFLFLKTVAVSSLHIFKQLNVTLWPPVERLSWQCLI